MRTLITNATLIDGTGTPPQEGVTVVLEDHLVAEIVERRAPYYDRGAPVLDAGGGFVLPGLINHHVHGLTRGPLMIVGEPALDERRVQANLDRLLTQGVTTALNVDGFATVEEAVASSRFHPVAVKASTLHTPTHLRWASERPFTFGGVKERHHWSVKEMLERGSPAIGEAGPGVDAHWPDYTLIPHGMAERYGLSVSVEQARDLRLAAEAKDQKRVGELLAGLGLGREEIEPFFEIYEATLEWQELARKSLEEAIGVAREQGEPLILHHTPGTFEAVAGAAEELGERVIAGHSNFQARDPEDAVGRARTLRQKGSWVDVMSGDAFGAREFHPTPEVTFRLLYEGVVDLISTDYAGGFWDPMLLVVEKAYEAGAVSLEEGVRLMTSAPAEAIPRLAPDRGRVVSGAVADVAVTRAGRLSDVQAVFVSGHRVGLPPREW